MKFNKVRGVHSGAEMIVTEPVYEKYQAEFVMLVEHCDPATGKKPVKKKVVKKKD